MTHAQIRIWLADMTSGEYHWTANEFYTYHDDTIEHCGLGVFLDAQMSYCCDWTNDDSAQSALDVALSREAQYMGIVINDRSTTGYAALIQDIKDAMEDYITA